MPPNSYPYSNIAAVGWLTYVMKHQSREYLATILTIASYDSCYTPVVSGICHRRIVTDQLTLTYNFSVDILSYFRTAADNARCLADMRVLGTSRDIGCICGISFPGEICWVWFAARLNKKLSFTHSLTRSHLVTHSLSNGSSMSVNQYYILQ